MLAQVGGFRQGSTLRSRANRSRSACSCGSGGFRENHPSENQLYRGFVYLETYTKLSPSSVVGWGTYLPRMDGRRRDRYTAPEEERHTLSPDGVDGSLSSGLKRRAARMPSYSLAVSTRIRSPGVLSSSSQWGRRSERYRQWVPGDARFARAPCLRFAATGHRRRRGWPARHRPLLSEWSASQHASDRGVSWGVACFAPSFEGDGHARCGRDLVELAGAWGF